MLRGGCNRDFGYSKRACQPRAERVAIDWIYGVQLVGVDVIAEMREKRCPQTS